MGQSATVRPAVQADAHGIAVVHVQAWRESYAHLVSAEALASLSVEIREQRWNKILAELTEVAMVADRDGEIVGWATASAGRDSDAPRPLELDGIYVLASEYGAGTGQALLNAVLGDAPAYLWVAADNPRAQAFYRRNGFVDDGTRHEHPLAGEPVEIARYVR